MLFTFLIQIDAEVIESMDDYQLKKFLPCMGDRLAVKQFCVKMKSKSDVKDFKKASRKDELLTAMRSKLLSSSECKMQEKSDGSMDFKSVKRQKVGSKSHSNFGMKCTRMIDIGLIDMSFGDGVKVKSANGGGTRHISVQKSYKSEDLIAKAVELFFPDGSGFCGALSECRCEILDYQKKKLNDEITVGDLYKNTKMGLLTYYLAVYHNDNIDESSNHRISESALDDNTSAQDVGVDIHCKDKTMNDVDSAEDVKLVVGNQSSVPACNSIPVERNHSCVYVINIGQSAGMFQYQCIECSLMISLPNELDENTKKIDKEPKVNAYAILLKGQLLKDDHHKIPS